MKLRDKVLIATLAGIFAAGPALAGDFDRHYRLHHAYHWGTEGGWGGDGLPTHVRGLGTFVGGFAATRIRHVGVFVNVAPGVVGGPVLDAPPQPVLAPPATVIHVSSVPKNGACSMEHGVCVIRPGR